MPYDHGSDTMECVGFFIVVPTFGMVLNVPDTWRLTIGSLSISPFFIERGHIVTLICPGARRLGAGAPITVLQFTLLVRLHPVLGFHALNCVCARFMKQGCVL
jgi:hypothetical protein